MPNEICTVERLGEGWGVGWLNNLSRYAIQWVEERGLEREILSKAG